MNAYKEWEAVCEALATGRQLVLLRKGGIHEGRQGFSFKHDEFVLFPTRFHAQAAQVRVPCEASGGEWQPGDTVPISVFCEAIWARTLTDWDQVNALAPFHIWTEAVVRDRFDCGELQQIHCALVRAHRLPRPWRLPYSRKFGGCRTWVGLEAPDPAWKSSLEAVLSDEEFRTRLAAIEAVLQ